jgi:hypothetical protein
MGCLTIFIILVALGLILTIGEVLFTFAGLYWLPLLVVFAAYKFYRQSKNSDGHPGFMLLSMGLAAFSLYQFQSTYQYHNKKFEVAVNASDLTSKISIRNADDDEVAEVSGKQNKVYLKRGTYTYSSSIDGAYEQAEDNFQVDDRLSLQVKLPPKERTYSSSSASTSYGDSSSSSSNSYSSSDYSSYGSSTSSSSGTGTVHVQGYTRSNGTYVAPYTRSSPRR